jgi:surfactin synthase thioesterase subunit
MFGHSMGAVLAFELTRRLRDRNMPPPAHLFVSGASAPQLPRADLGLRFIEDGQAFLEAVAATYGGVPRIVLESRELRAAAVGPLRADLSITEPYVFAGGAPLDCPLTAYGGQADPNVTAAALAAWREQTTGAFRCRVFDGGHFYLNRARDALMADIVNSVYG